MLGEGQDRAWYKLQKEKNIPPHPNFFFDGRFQWLEKYVETQNEMNILNEERHLFHDKG